MARTDIPKMKLDFEKMIGAGEMNGVDGFRAETPNGVAYWKGTGKNKGARGGWAPNNPYVGPDVEPDATRPAGRSNRTAE